MPKNAVSKTVNMLIAMLTPRKSPNTPAMTKPKKPNTPLIKNFKPFLKKKSLGGCKYGDH